MLYLTGDNSSMWNVGNLMGAIFFLVIVILGIVVWRIVAGGSKKSNVEE